MSGRAMFCFGVLLTSVGGLAAAGAPAPITVSPGSPAEVVQVGERCPTFSWGAGSPASAYHLAVYHVDEKAAEQVRVVLTQELPGSASSWTPPLHRCLESGAVYAWRVGAATGEDEPVWSEPAWFEVPVLGAGQPGVVTAGTSQPPKGITDLGTTSGSVATDGSGSAQGGPAPTTGAARALASYFSVGSGGTVTAGPVTATSFTGDGSGLTNLLPGNIAAGTAAIDIAGNSATATTVTPLTAGGLLFGSATNTIGQDAEYLYWDDTNNRLDLDGNLQLPATGAAGAAGVVQVGGPRFLHSFGTGNTFLGAEAGNFSMGGDPGDGAYNTGIGFQSLTANTTGHDNTAVAWGALHSNTTGWYNTAVGVNSLGNNDSGAENVAVGIDALYSNTSGNDNLAVGFEAMRANTTAVQNVAVGNYSLRANTTAQQNTAVGTWALYTQSFSPGERWSSYNTAVGYTALQANNPTWATLGETYWDGNGVNNTAVGASALRFNTTGKENTALGSQALRLNTLGSHNTAAGAWALYSNTTAEGNVAVGTKALFTQSFSNSDTGYETGNTAVGVEALFSNQPTDDENGVYNTALGMAALHDNTIGNYNVAAGAGALMANTTASKNTALGVTALFSQSYDGSQTPWDSFNTAIGFEALYSNQPTASGNGISNTAIGSQALKTNTIGSNNIAVGRLAGTNLTTGDYNIDIGNQGVAGESATIRIGDANQTRTFVTGIHGVTPGGATLQVVIDANGQLGTADAPPAAPSESAPVATDLSSASVLAEIERQGTIIETQQRLIIELVERLARLEALLKE